MTRVLRVIFLPLVFMFVDLAHVSAQQSGTSSKSNFSKRFRDYEQYALRHQGDPLKGKKLFEAAQSIKCATCHKIQGQGGDIGPDLSSIGGKFDRPHLIESLLEPSRQIVEGYRTTVVLTNHGKVVTGILKVQDNQQITLLDANGKTRTISRAQIDELSQSPVSLMPEGLAKELSAQEFTDLIAYLESLRKGKQYMGSGVVGPISLPPGFEVRTITTGLSGATALEVIPDGRVLICEQTGSVRVVENGKLLEKPLVTLPVEAYWERGVIGVTYDPAFPRDPYIYVCWVAKKPYPHHRVSRFTVRGNVALAGSEKVLLVGDDQSKMGGDVPAGHQGGALHFGADGKLYISIGEQTSGLPSQNLDTFLGKILRINRDGSIPADNPFVDEAKGKYRAIWARGARNPFTFAIRSSDDLMLINDVGGKCEEINIGQAGANYGWPVVQHGDQKEYQTKEFEGPIYWYPESSINGADFCEENSAWPKEQHSRYFFADFVEGWIKSIDPEKPSGVTTFGTGFRRPVGLRFAPDGSLYVLLRNAWVIDDKFGGDTGSLLQIRYRGKGKGQRKQVAKPTPPSVRLTENSVDESAGGLPAFKIQTPSATYYLEKNGGGLSSLVDSDGNDWIGFHPEKGTGAGGEYRGFPNAVHEQAGNYFHPKNEATDLAKTRVERVSSHYVSIVAESESGHWSSRFEFYPTHCVFTMTRMPEEQKYWVLYEGVPGGQFDRSDWWMTSGMSTHQPMTKRHEGDIPAPEWIAFGDQQTQRSLVLLHHDNDDHPDTFYQMQNQMTVFGFGRKDLGKFQSSVGQRYSIGLINGDSHSAISQFVTDTLLTSKGPYAVAASEEPKVEIWYGDHQRFGHNGVPQRWVNVLGRVSPPDNVTMTYSLNGADSKSLSIGPNHTRLAQAGDFNVELETRELQNGENRLVINAVYPSGENLEKTVNVSWAPKLPHELPLRVDWQSADTIQDVAQVVDGLWKLTPRGVRVVEPYYDRVLAIGDMSWTDYEVTVPVTFHGFLKPGPTDGGRLVVHAAIAVRWPGHARGPKPTQPLTQWYPLGATAEFMIQEHPRECRWRILGGGNKKAEESSSRQIEFDKPYMMKHRVESIGKSKTRYQVKFWDAEKPEPAEWNLTAEEEGDVPKGGALLLAHYSDVTFGNVTVTSCKENQVAMSNSSSGLPIPVPHSASLASYNDPVSQETTQELGPKPGDVYREYAVHNGGGFDWRVTDPNASSSGAQEFLPNPILNLNVLDLRGAIRAEAVLDRWGGHAGTKQKMVRFNSNEWIPIPELATTPAGHDPERYHSQDNPVIAVPLDHLKTGDNTLEGIVGPGNETNWGQWGLYSLILRVYYDPDMKKHSTGRISSPASRETLAENPTIELQYGANTERIDVIAWYDGYDEDGNGVFNEWHATRFQPFLGKAANLECHVGTIDPSTTESKLTWDTRWIPDQKQNAVKLIARIHSNDDLIYITDIVDGLSLERKGWSVKQYRATNVPEEFGVRVGQTKFCDIPIATGTDLSRATQAVLHYRTWEARDGRHEPFQLNGYKHPNKGKNHHYDYDLLPIPVAELKKGNNRFTIHSNTEHHMLEVLWPGPAISVRFKTNE